MGFKVGSIEGSEVGVNAALHILLLLIIIIITIIVNIIIIKE